MWPRIVGRIHAGDRPQVLREERGQMWPPIARRTPPAAVDGRSSDNHSPGRVRPTRRIVVCLARLAWAAGVGIGRGEWRTGDVFRAGSRHIRRGAALGSGAVFAMLVFVPSAVSPTVTAKPGPPTPFDSNGYDDSFAVAQSRPQGPLIDEAEAAGADRRRGTPARR